MSDATFTPYMTISVTPKSSIMEDQAMYPNSTYDPLGLAVDPSHYRVDPREPLSSSHAHSQEAAPGNGMARATSKRRRPAGSGSGRSLADQESQPPAAPEVPKAPPISYRPPIPNGYQRTNFDYPASFADRARSLSERPLEDPQNSLPSPTESAQKRERRASLNRPIGGLYAEIQQHHKRDSGSSAASSSRRSSLPARVPRPPQSNGIPTSPKASRNTPVQTAADTSSPISSQSTARQRSPLVSAEKPTRKEWAVDHSPLQKLEVKLGDISKEEKRARVERAEERLRRSKEKHQHRSIDSHHPHHRPDPQRDSLGLTNTEPTRTRQEHPDSNKVVNPRGGLSPRGQGQRAENTATSQAAQTTNGPQKSSKVGRPSVDGASQLGGSNDHVERGVRFQPASEPAAATVSKAGATSRDQPVTDLDSKDSRAAKRNSLRQKDILAKRNSGIRDVPSAQQNLYSNRMARDAKFNEPRSETLEASKNVNGVQRTQAPTYDVPPASSAGMNARQKVGLGSNSTTVAQNIPDRKHHLPNFLHRHPDKAVESHNYVSENPKIMNEWKGAGVARLTAADFLDHEDVESEHAWWEKGSSGRRRKSQRNSRNASGETHVDQTTYVGSTGKSSPQSPFDSLEDADDAEVNNAEAPHARLYVQPDRSEQNREVQSGGLKDQVHSFVTRMKGVKAIASASSYSYSCPELAYHNPLHPDHVCEPEQSRELIQSMRAIRIRTVPGVSTFNPPLYLKCGPLLRYTGMKRDKLGSNERGQPINVERETWRGSVMIVTADSDSKYEPAPVLRLFPEPMDLVPPPTEKIDDQNRNDMPSELVDPIAGLPKLSRTGRTVYVKPVDDLGEAVDLSHIENDDGLFEETRTAAVPTSYGTPEYSNGRKVPASKRQDAPKVKRGHRVRGVRLHAERGATFWRFNLEVELTDEQARIAYSINNGPAVGFWVPARGQTMNIMFHSCNGFSLSVNPDDFSGPDPLWRDVLNSHQSRPFHVMIGGGDQIYNDAVMRQSPLFGQWLETRNPHHKHEAEFTPAMQEELETFYLEHYSMWFSQGLFGMANSQIPMVNIWDDHDIIDGFGSYPDHFMSTPVFCGIGAVAFKYYMLFQHQSVSEETSADEPSWLLGAAPGPYITELSRNVFVSLGKHVSFLGLDCRTERMRDEIVSEATYDIVLDRCRREIIKGETKHLIVLLGVPIAYPRLVWLENLLTSRVMDPVKALGRVGLLGNFLNKFDGGVEILDDLDDHWTAKNHKQERNWFVEELQALAADLSVRVTILGGDVHLAAIGQFFSNPRLKISKDHDHRYMANIISSAIVNTPPPEMMGDILNKRNKTHHLDPDTDENMIPMFTHDVDGKYRNNKRLLPRRNWCSIREYHPGSTPPPTPPPSDPGTESEEEGPPPLRARFQRTMSLTREDARPGNLIRRLSGRGPPQSYVPAGGEGDPESPTSPPMPAGDPFLPRPVARSSTLSNGISPSIQQLGSAPLPRPGTFHRMPTNFSEKAVLKGDPTSRGGHINLENGLDIVLNCEINQRDPAGATTPYRLLVPALYYQGPADVNTLPFRRRSVIQRISSFRGRRKSQLANHDHQDNVDGDSQNGSDSASETDYDEPLDERPRRWSFGLTQRRQYRDQTPPNKRELQQSQNRNGEPSFVRSQQQRQSDNRSQQIGSPRAPNVSIPDTGNSGVQGPARMRAMAKLTGQPTNQVDGGVDSGESLPRRDSVDYHEHLDASNLQQQQNLHNGGPPARRPSKIDRMLGVARNPRGVSGPPVEASDYSPYSSVYGHDDHNGKGRGFSMPWPIRRTLSLGGKREYDEATDDGYDGHVDGSRRMSWKRFFS